MKTTKKALSFVLSLALLISSVSGLTISNNAAAAETAQKIIVYVAAEGTNVSGASVSIDKTPVLLEEGSYAEDAIKTVLDSTYPDDYVISENSWGDSLDAIGEVAQTADWSAYWNFCVNGEMASLGISAYELQDQDQISLIYGGYPLSTTECSSFFNDTSLAPDKDAQAALFTDAKAQQTLLAEKIYSVNFGNGTYIPDIMDTDSIYCIYALLKSGYSADTFYNAVADQLTAQLKDFNDTGSTSSVTTEGAITLDYYEGNKYVDINYTKIALFLAAMGRDITNAGGMDLTKKITNKDLYAISNPTTLTRETMILFAMNEAGATWPAGEDYLTESELVNNLLADVDTQIGFSLVYGADSAAMVIQALAPYTNKTLDGVDTEAVTATVNTVLGLISNLQDKSGAYLSPYDGSSNVWTLAQVMITVGTFGINPLTDNRFIKNGKTLFDISATFVDTKNGTVDENLVGGAWAYQPDQLLRGLNACINVAKDVDSENNNQNQDNNNVVQNNNNNNNNKVTPTPAPTKTTNTKTSTKLTKPVVKKLTSKKKKTLTVAFKKVKNAKKYKIQISTNKNFKKNVKTKTVKTVKKVTFKKLKSGKKYYVRIRAIKGNTKSKWSKVKSKKVK